MSQASSLRSQVSSIALWGCSLNDMVLVLVYFCQTNLLFRVFSWGTIWLERFALCTMYILQVCALTGEIKPTKYFSKKDDLVCQRERLLCGHVAREKCCNKKNNSCKKMLQNSTILSHSAESNVTSVLVSVQNFTLAGDQVKIWGPQHSWWSWTLEN